MAGKISRNFTFEEFTKSDVARRFHINNAITSWEVRDNIIALVENVLQPLRDAWGEPLFINSGYRCPELNSHSLVGGSKTSQHVTGQAADVASSDPYGLAKMAKKMKLPYDQCIVYPTFTHFSFRANGENRNQILYSAKYKGRKDL